MVKRGNYGRNFWTGRGMRHRCPLSPILFNVKIVDIEEDLGRNGIRGINLGETRSTALAYADDLVLAEKEEDEMTDEEIGDILGKKGLELNVDKIKIIRKEEGG